MKSLQKNVLEYLDESARRYPLKTAFTDGRREETFRTFQKRAMAVGTAITRRTGAHNRPVAVLVDRDLLCLTAMMGILYSGNYYIPIDNKMPKQRLETVFLELDPEMILYREEDSDCVTDFSDRFDLMSVEEAVTAEIDTQAIRERRDKVLDIDPVYIIYTSGSTGSPKGIVVSHRGVIDLIEWMVPCFGVTDQNVMGNQAPFYFDGSVKDIYLTLKSSACMHIIPRNLFTFPVKLIEFLDRKRVNTLAWSTSAFNLVAGSGVLDTYVPKHVRLLAIGGEAMRAKNMNIWKRAIPDITVFNIYGPTEAVVDCAYYKVERNFEDYEAIPIGKACENKEILLLDENLRLVRDGEPGEICVRGTGLARGYYGDFEKTNAAFVQNPLNPHYPDVIYRTGDIGKMNDRGEIVFQSRADSQIKHMGYRIELGEIERALNSMESMKNAACLYDQKKEKIVCFYEGNTDTLRITRHLKSIIPKYMFPNVYRPVQSMPYNATGKIDRVKLREVYEAEEGT